MKKWNWKAILGIWVVKFSVSVILQLAFDFLLIHLKGPSFHGLSSIVNSVPRRIFASANEAIANIISGYWIAAVVPNRKMGHAVWLTATIVGVGLIFLSSNSHRDQPVWLYVLSFLLSAFTLLGAWWRIKTHGTETAPRMESVPAPERPPIASPFED